MHHRHTLLCLPLLLSTLAAQTPGVWNELPFATRPFAAAVAGVFAATVSGLDKRHLPGAASLGVRPTLGLGLCPVLEVHLFDFDREIYGAHLTVHFLHKLRDEARFDSFEALTAQIARDVAVTQDYFAGKPLGAKIDDCNG